jgi:hypothetical protein
MMQFANTVKGPPWSNIVVPLSRENLQKRKSYFVCDPMNAPADGGLPISYVGSLDSTLYFTSRLIIATGGQLNQSIIGDLWVEYEVELTTPELANAIVPPFTGAKINSNTAQGATNTEPLKGSITSTVPGEVKKFLFDTATNGNILKFAQDFKGVIDGVYTGTGITSVPNGISLKAHLDTNYADVEGVSTYTYSAIRADGLLGSFFVEVDSKAGEQLAGFNSLVTATTISSCALRLTAYNAPLLK